MKQVVIGTAGHIDHGKTALVKALTGIDTDNLPEEKERGMTIDLGFAFLTEDITIIDVPGHEKFIRNMVAGVSTIDIALITIAADDGIMPQTREHIDILHLLGVKLGCIVITKIDLIEDPEWLDLLEEDIRRYVKGSSFEDIPILRVSSVNGQGVKEVESHLINQAKSEVKKGDRGFFRLFVDRVFTMKGFGTVVTGTVVSGSLGEGDEVDILPRGGVAKIRGIQSHGLKVQSVRLGDRAALNLSNVSKSAINRGFQLVSRRFIKPTDVVGAEITLLPQTERIIRHEQRVRVHIGTDEIIGRVLLARPGRKRVKPKETSAVLIKLEKEAAVAMGDPLILRFYSPPETMGGGIVIDPHPPDRWKFCRGWLDSLVGLNQQERLKKFLVSQANAPLTINEWSQKWQLSSTLFRQILNGLETTQFGSKDNCIVSLTALLKNQKRFFLETVENFHKQFPYKRGKTRDNLRQHLKFSIPLFDFLTVQLEREGKIEVIEGLVKKRGYHISLSKKDQELTDCIEDDLRKARSTPPAVSELATRCNLSVPHLLQLIHVLKSEGKVMEIEQDLWFHTDQINKIERGIRNFFKTNSSMTVSDFKSFTHTTRKYAIPLLEHFDKLRITQRDGGLRILYS